MQHKQKTSYFDSFNTLLQPVCPVFERVLSSITTAWLVAFRLDGSVVCRKYHILQMECGRQIKFGPSVT